jgi:hypothetical protein
MRTIISRFCDISCTNWLNTICQCLMYLCGMPWNFLSSLCHILFTIFYSKQSFSVKFCDISLFSSRNIKFTKVCNIPPHSFKSFDAKLFLRTHTNNTGWRVQIREILIILLYNILYCFNFLKFLHFNISFWDTKFVHSSFIVKGGISYL